MSQCDELLRLFKENGNKLTLGQILGNWPRIGSKYTNRISELRIAGYEITCKEDRETPTLNEYTLKESAKVDEVGQRVWAW